MATGNIRRAKHGDLPEIYDIWYENEVAGDPNPPPRNNNLSGFRHELETGEMYVVEKEHRVVAFAALLTRSSIAYLSEFFVRPGCQSSGIGQRLLRHILPVARYSYCTLSSSDPRAIALYIRAGMCPQWPNFLLRANGVKLDKLPVDEVEAIEGEAGDPVFVDWDAVASGRYRPVEHAYWLQEAGAVPLWFQRGDERVGYGYVQMRNAGSLWYPSAITIGPIGVRTAGEALPCVSAAVRWATRQADIVRIAVPGPHPALARLLEAGFKIGYTEMFVSSAVEPFLDARRYIPAWGMLSLL